MNDTPLRTREASLFRRDLIVRALSLRAESIDESERSVEAVLTTEAPTLVLDLSNWRIIEEVLVIAGMESAAQVVMLDSHQRSSVENVRGSVREIRQSGKRALGRLYFAEDASSESAWQKVRQGHVTDVSVGYRELEYMDIAPGESETVDGKRYRARDRTLRVTTRWELREVSLVPIGADRAAKLRDDGSAAVNKTLRTYLESIGLRADASEESARDFFALLDGEQKIRALALDREAADDAAATNEDRDMPATPELGATRTTPPERPDRAGGNGTSTGPPRAAQQPAVAGERDADERALVLGERDRVREVIRLGELSGAPAELQQRAMFEGWDAARTARTFLERMRERSEPVGPGDGPVVHVRNHDADCTARALSAGMMIRSNLPPVDPNARPNERQEQERAADAGYRYRDMSLLDICREAIRIDGRGGTLPHTRHDQIRAAVSGGALTGIFTTVVNAQLMQSYMQSADSTVGWVREVDVPDFKSNERIRLGQGGNLTRHRRGDPADHAKASDTTEEYKIARYSKQFVIDEQDIIDDRLGALRDMPELMGQASRRLRPDLVYAILLVNATLADGVALFATAHANYATSGSALASATLEAGVAAMAKQTEDAVNLNVEARHLIVPQDLKFTAAVLLRSAQRIIASASGGTFNPLQDLDINLHSDNRIGVAGVTDPVTGTAHAGTATNWFLAASPTMAPTIEVGYLAGTGRAPMLRSFVLDRGQWGVGFDVKMDIGAKALDYRGMYKATGAS